MKPRPQPVTHGKISVMRRWDPREDRPYTLIWSAVAVGLVATLCVLLVTDLRFAYRSPLLHVSLESGEGVIALVAAVMVYGRYRQVKGLGDLLLVCALGLLGLTNIFLSAIPTIVVETRSESFPTWAPLIARAVGAILLAASPFVSSRTPEGPVVPLKKIAVGCLLAIGAIALLVGLLGSNLPQNVGGISSSLSTIPRFSGDPWVMALHVVRGLLFAAATVGFYRRSISGQDELYAWLAGATVLATFSQVHYLLFPSLYTDHIYTGDLLRISFYAMLLIGSIKEIFSYWEKLARVAVSEERRRIARDLHDGLANELFFIRAQAWHMTRTRASDEELGRLASASERALYEARRAVSALSASYDRPLGASLTSTAEEIARPAGTKVVSSISTGVSVGAAEQEAMLRIVKESVANAVRHGRAKLIEVTLSQDGATHLVVKDDGAGFDLKDGTFSPGFGLRNMRERVEAVGGEFRVTSTIGHGCSIEAIFPSG